MINLFFSFLKIINNVIKNLNFIDSARLFFFFCSAGFGIFIPYPGVEPHAPCIENADS